MVVLTRAPMAPEVASDKDSRSKPISQNKIQNSAMLIIEPKISMNFEGAKLRHGVELGDRVFSGIGIVNFLLFSRCLKRLTLTSFYKWVRVDGYPYT